MKFDTKTVFLGALLVFILVLVGVGPLKDHTDNLTTAHSQLCGGRLDFATSVDSLAVLHAQDTVRFDADTAFEALDRTLQTRAVQELISGKAADDREYSLFPWDYAFEGLVQLRTANILKTTTGMYSPRAPLDCHDALDLTLLQNISYQLPHIQRVWHDFARQRRVWLHNLRSLPGSSPAGQSCADFVNLCSEQLVKAVCPWTCGCNSMLHGDLTDGTSMDCPMTCRRSVDAREKATTTCEDASLNNASDPKWQRMVEYADFLGWPDKAILLNMSCDGLVFVGTSQFCESPTWVGESEPLRTALSPAADFRLKLFTFICPVTCNCGGRGGPASSSLSPPAKSCPDSCTCPWEYATAPTGDGSNCSVPHYVQGYGLEPVAVDTKCCFLMNEASRLFAMELTGALDFQAWMTLEKVLCHSCYRECLSSLWSMRVVGSANQSFASAYLLAQYGAAQPSMTARDTMCSMYDSGQVMR